MMKILRAEHLGMCFGVRDAIDLAKRQSESGSLTILGDLVHNESVLKSLRQHGIAITREVASVTSKKVMITAHGASRKAIQNVRLHGHHVVEATCPLVHRAHQELHHLVTDGYHPVIVGQRDHVEVKGLTGDLDQFDVILEVEEVANLGVRKRFGVMAQTTQTIRRVQEIAQAIRDRFSGVEVRVVDTVCQPTKQRQNAAVSLARRCDVVVVIGGSQSNNTRQLETTCRRFCPRVVRVQDSGDLRQEWFHQDDVVGITAGTSTPDSVIDEVQQQLTELFKVIA